MYIRVHTQHMYTKAAAVTLQEVQNVACGVCSHYELRLERDDDCACLPACLLVLILHRAVFRRSCFALPCTL